LTVRFTLGIGPMYTLPDSVKGQKNFGYNAVNSRFSDPFREFSRQHNHAGMHCKSINTVKLDLVTP
jgi:hypothetical protein